LSNKSLLTQKPWLLAAALLAACANPAAIDPIEGRTFIVEERTRQEVWDAAVAALAEQGRVESSEFDQGELRGYAGSGVTYSAVLVSMRQLYPGEDTYTVSVATDAMAPLADAEPARDALIEAMRTNLKL